MEALPFELDPYTARILAQTLAMAKSKDSRLQKRYLYPLAMIVRHFFGVGPADRMEAAKANVDKMQAVYLPYWIVDGNLSIQAKNSSGEATKLNLVSINSRMPGFDFAPLRSLPLAPPQLDEAVQYQRFTKALVDGPAATLKAFMRKRHSVQVDGQSALPKQAEVLPFVTSPLSLSALFRDASAYASEVKLPNFASSPLKHGYTLVAMDETTAAQKIRLQGETLDVDMLAAYAVMLPFYVVKFKPVVDEEGQRKPPMVVVQSAWFDECELVARSLATALTQLTPSCCRWYSGMLHGRRRSRRSGQRHHQGLVAPIALERARRLVAHGLTAHALL